MVEFQKKLFAALENRYPRQTEGGYESKTKQKLKIVFFFKNDVNIFNIWSGFHLIRSTHPHCQQSACGTTINKVILESHYNDLLCSIQKSPKSQKIRATKAMLMGLVTQNQRKRNLLFERDRQMSKRARWELVPEPRFALKNTWRQK